MKKKGIAIIVALEKEAQSFLKKIENKKQSTLANKRLFTGKINGKNVALIISGIGKVSAALATQALIDAFSPSIMINFGTVGGIDNSVIAKNYYMIDKCCQYDFNLSDLDDVPLGYIQDYDTVFFKLETANIDCLEKRALATADRFTCNPHDIEIVKNCECALCDMEGAAIAQVCVSNNIPLYIIKGVTDIFGSGTNQEQFLLNLKDVSSGFADVIISLIERL